MVSARELVNKSTSAVCGITEREVTVPAKDTKVSCKFKEIM
jgi:hypothetical protein